MEIIAAHTIEITEIGPFVIVDEEIVLMIVEDEE